MVRLFRIVLPIMVCCSVSACVTTRVAVVIDASDYGGSDSVSSMVFSMATDVANDLGFEYGQRTPGDDRVALYRSEAAEGRLYIGISTIGSDVIVVISGPAGFGKSDSRYQIEKYLIRWLENAGFTRIETRIRSSSFT